MLKLDNSVVEALIAHARQDAPIEACGYLAEKDGIVSQIYRLKNVDAAQEHFTLDPAEQFTAVRDMRKFGYRLRAVYHSHPATPARPSQEDIRLAHDLDMSYVIVSLAATQPDVKSFTIRHGEVSPEPIEVVAIRVEQGFSPALDPAASAASAAEVPQGLKARLRINN